MTIVDRLRFHQYITNLCFKAAMQLNALGPLQKYMAKTEKAAIINSFTCANFNYCPLVWHFSTLENPEALPENSPWWLWQRLWCPAKKKWKFNNGNKAFKSSSNWNF